MNRELKGGPPAPMLAQPFANIPFFPSVPGTVLRLLGSPPVAFAAARDDKPERTTRLFVLTSSTSMRSCVKTGGLKEGPLPGGGGYEWDLPPQAG